MATNIMLQGFHWESANPKTWYLNVQSKVDDIKAAGFTHIWLPPPSQSLAKEGYQPQQYYDLDHSAYGAKTELTGLIQDLKSKGIHPMADIVINHRSAEDKAPNGQYIQFEDKVDHPGRRIDWGPWAVCRDCPFYGDGGNDTGEHAGFAPDVDHTNDGVRASLKDWLNWLKNTIGFDGFRFDMVKGYGPGFIKEYLDATGTSGDGANLCVGENWTADFIGTDAASYDQNPARQFICNWINGTGDKCMAFDFPTKFVLNTAVKGGFTLWRLIDPQGKPPGLLGWWPQKAVTFVENHDTEPCRNNGHEMPWWALQLAYAYILTHPGTPCVFWRHLYDWSDAGLPAAIRALMAARIRNGIKADSPITIYAHDADLYMTNVANKLIVKLGPRYDLGPLTPSAKDGWNLACSGQNWAVWEKH